MKSAHSVKSFLGGAVLVVFLIALLLALLIITVIGFIAGPKKRYVNRISFENANGPYHAANSADTSHFYLDRIPQMAKSATEVSYLTTYGDSLGLRLSLKMSGAGYKRDTGRADDKTAAAFLDAERHAGNFDGLYARYKTVETRSWKKVTGTLLGMALAALVVEFLWSAVVIGAEIGLGALAVILALVYGAKAIEKRRYGSPVTVTKISFVTPALLGRFLGDLPECIDASHVPYFVEGESVTIITTDDADDINVSDALSSFLPSEYKKKPVYEATRDAIYMALLETTKRGVELDQSGESLVAKLTDVQKRDIGLARLVNSNG